MGRQGVTFSDVERAFRTLQAQGKPATIEAIRSLLGSGSKSTIIRHLHSLKNSHPDSTQHPHSPPPPELLSLVSALWDKMQETPSGHAAIAPTESAYATAAVEKILLLQKQLAKLQKQLQERSRALTELEIRFEHQKQALQAREQEISKKNISIQELGRRVTLLANELQQTRLAATQLQKQLITLQLASKMASGNPREK